MIFKYNHNYFTGCAVVPISCAKHSFYILIFSLLCLFNNPVFGLEAVAKYKGTVNIQHWFTHNINGVTYEGTCNGTGTMVIILGSSNMVAATHNWEIKTLDDTCEVRERHDTYNYKPDSGLLLIPDSSHDGTTFNNAWKSYNEITMLNDFFVLKTYSGKVYFNGQVSGNVLTGTGEGAPSRPDKGWDFRTTISFSLPLEGTELPASPPTIQLVPDPNDGLEFQKSIVRGHGFRIRAVDPAGFNNIDWSTFKISIAGVDKTQHFVLTALALPTPMQQEATENSMTFRFQPDPTQFMDSQNIFNIYWNGNWPVTLEVCNRTGVCGKTEYSIYFGPFIDIGNARDRRCSIGNRELVLSNIVYGNIGAPGVGPLYIGIQRTGNQQRIFSLMMIFLPYTDYGWFYGIHPVATIPFATGIYTEMGFGTNPIVVNEDVFDYPQEEYLEEHALQADSNLQHELVFAVYDRSASDIYIGRLPVELCLPQP